MRLYTDREMKAIRESERKRRAIVIAVIGKKLPVWKIPNEYKGYVKLTCIAYKGIRDTE